MEPTWLITFCGETVIGAVLMKLRGKLLGRPLDECEQEVGQATKRARLVFHDHYGDRYGPSGKTFIDRESNTKRLLRSAFPRGKRLAATDIDLRGFEGVPDVPEKAVATFLDAFYNAINQTNSRDLDRDLSLQDATRERSEIREGVDELKAPVNHIGAQVSGVNRKLDAALNQKIFPDNLRTAIAQPSLDDLSELMKARRLLHKCVSGAAGFRNRRSNLQVFFKGLRE